MRSYLLQILSLLLFLQAPAFAADPTFIEKLHSFTRLFEQRLSKDFLKQIEQDSRFSYANRLQLAWATQTILQGNEVLAQEEERLYRVLYLGQEGEGALRDLDLLEMRLGVLANKALRGAAVALIDAKIGDYLAAAQAYQIPETPTGTDRGVVETFRMVNPFHNTTATFACTLLWDMCLRNRSILQIFHNPRLVQDTRKPGTQIQYNRSIQDLGLEEDAVVFVVMNHDVVLLEASLIADMSDAFAPATRFGVGIRATYPHLKFWSNPEPNLFFIEDKNMVGNLLAAITNTPGRVLIGIFPEGNRATFGAQVPLSTKPGVPMMALRLAREKNRPRPVYVLPMRYNALEYATTDSKNLNVEIGEPIRILAKAGNVRVDLEALRLQIEEFINFERGTRMLDLQNPAKLRGTWGIYRSSLCEASIEGSL